MDTRLERGAPGLRPALRRPTCSTPRCCACRWSASSPRRTRCGCRRSTRWTRELVTDSLVYRYNPAASPDGLRGDEGTFSICTFWYVEALARAGRLDEARLAFEKMLTYANHLGLYSEEIAPTGEQLGNFPQAFTHLARSTRPSRWTANSIAAGRHVKPSDSADHRRDGRRTTPGTPLPPSAAS